MRPEDHQTWESGPAPDWNREGVWNRIAERRVRSRRALLGRRFAVAASVLLLVLAGGTWLTFYGTTADPAGPDEILPMMKDRELDTGIAPDGDSLYQSVPTTAEQPRPRYLSD